MNRRCKKKKQQIKAQELWGLDVHLAKLILPKLKAFREMHRISYPCNLKNNGGFEEWNNILDKMIFAFQYVVEEDKCKVYLSDYDKYEEGIKLFAEYFMDLWD